MWKVYDKTGTKVRCEVRKVQYSGTFMGECFVNTTLHSELPIEFEIGDYFIYRNEQFTINYDPSVLKKAGARKSGEAYVYDGVKFNSFSDELTRCDFLDYVLEDNFLHFSALPTFSFFASSIKDLADRIQANLDRIYTGDQKWIVEVHSEYVNTTNVNIDVSKIKVWGALEFIKSKFNANFIIRGRKIIIGTAGVAIDNVFQYGKGNGLVEIQRVADSNQQLVTRLRVYGSERNIPVRYYNLPKIVDVKISRSGWGVDYGYWIQFNVAYSEERFSHNTEFTCSGRNIKGSWKHHNQYGEILEIEHEDYLFINNGKHKAVTKFISGAKLAAFPPENVFIPNLPNNMAVRNLMLPDFPKLTNDPYLDSENISSLGIREGSVFFDGSTEGLEEIYPSMEGMTAQQLIDAGISCDVDSGDNGNLDEIFTDATDKDGKIISDDGKWDELKEGANIPPFNLTLKDIGFDINDYLTGETATISMKDGMCGGREFEITKCLKKGNKYVLTCNRVYDDGLKLYFPYKDYNIKAGDKFVLLNIDMPEVYIYAASQRLLKAGKEFLAKNDYVRYTYEVKIDEIYMARRPELYSILKEGDLMLFTEPDFHIDGSIIIDSLRITEGEGLIPTYEVTLADDKQVGTIEKIQNSIDSIVNGQGIGGYNAQQINSLISAYGSKLFVSKKTNDIIQGYIQFLKGIDVTKGITTDTLTATEIRTQIIEVIDRLFAKDATFFGNVSSTDYAEKLLGWLITDTGAIDAKSLRLREFLEVPELRYNRVSIVSGEEWNAPGGGIIEAVDEENGIIYLKLEPGETAQVEKDDICKATFNNETGFQTAFFRITEKLSDSTFKYVLRSGYAFHPCKAMHFVAYGNFTNEERQKSSYSTQNYVRYLTGVNNWDITKDMIAMQLGDLSNLKLFGIDMTGHSAYLRNIYMTGVIKQISDDGVTESRVPCFKGVWVAGSYYYYDQVTHAGSSWLCITEEPTDQEPSDESTDWLKLVSKGEQGEVGESIYRLDIIASQGATFYREGQPYNATFTCKLFYGTEEVTDTLPDACFDYTRISGDPDNDPTWNQLHKGIGSVLSITESDLVGDVDFSVTVYSIKTGKVLLTRKI